MGRAAFALWVASLLLAGMADRTPPSRIVSVTVGENVTLDCLCEDTNVVMLFWFKQDLGQSPKMLSKYYKHDKAGTLSDEYQTRFHLETTQNQNRLRISNVQLSDSATYHCITGYLYIYEFRESITVSVRGSRSNVSAVVHQWPSRIVRPKDAMTLSCTFDSATCDEEHSVYWFRNSKDSQPALIYDHGERKDKCERKDNTRTCHYSLSVEKLGAFGNGTFYCAVVSCGRIMFGEGTRLYSEDKVNSPPVLLIYVLSVALALTIILAVWLAIALHKAKGCQYADSAVGSNVEDHQDEDNLHYAAILVPRLSRAGGQRHDDPSSECVYTSVKHLR